MSVHSDIAVRLVSALLVVLGVTFVVFMLLRWVPGDPIDLMLGEYAASADRAALSAQLGLDQPWWVQWLRFLGGLAHLDLGHALAGGQPIVALVGAHFLRTLQLAAAALVLALCAGLPLGVMAALRAGRAWDHCVSVCAVLGMSLPSFVLGPLLIIIFAVWLRWLPISGADASGSLLLPALTLACPMAAMLARMTRAALLDVLHAPFVTAARARGLYESTVILGHACRAAAVPVATVIGLQLGALLGGAVVTESVFGWPGVGQLVIEAIQRRDYPVVQACALVISLSYIVVNTATDVLNLRLDPRSRR